MNPYIKSTAIAEPALSSSSSPKCSNRHPPFFPIDVGLDDIFRAVSVVDLDADGGCVFDIDEDGAADKGAVRGGSVLPYIEYSDRCLRQGAY